MTLAITVLVLLLWPLLLKLFCQFTLGKCFIRRDMTGMTVLITGASEGLGKATALNLAQRNARVLMACRNLEKAEKVRMEIIAATGNTQIKVKHLELESFSSVRKCARDVLETEKRLDVLINNAGVVDYEVFKTEDGWERSIQVNHLGHFLLTLLLLGLLRKTGCSRIINVSSLVYLFALLNVEDMDGSKHNPFLLYIGNLYSRTKLANILFTKELAERLDGTGVTVNALHPGIVKTELINRVNHPMSSLIKYLYFLGKTPEEGAQTIIYLAVHPEVARTTGKFFIDCKEVGVIGKANDKALARKFFEISEKCVGEKCKDWISNLT